MEEPIHFATYKQPRGPKPHFPRQKCHCLADEFTGKGFASDKKRPYGSFHEVQLGLNENYQAWLHIEGLYHLGETRSVEECGIFQPKCRQRGSVLDVDETFGLLPPQDRGKLFEATLRLLRLMWVEKPVDVTDDEEHLRRALLPLVHNRFFFIWMLHGSTKVVVRAVALLSAKTKEKVANSLKKCFRESNILETNKQRTPTT